MEYKPEGKVVAIIVLGNQAAMQDDFSESKLVRVSS